MNKCLKGQYVVISPLDAYLLFTDIVFRVGGYGGYGSEVADPTTQQEAEQHTEGVWHYFPF